MKNILFVDSDPVMLHAQVGLLKNQSNFLHFIPETEIEIHKISHLLSILNKE